MMNTQHNPPDAKVDLINMVREDYPFNQVLSTLTKAMKLNMENNRNVSDWTAYDKIYLSAISIINSFSDPRLNKINLAANHDLQALLILAMKIKNDYLEACNTMNLNKLHDQISDHINKISALNLMNAKIDIDTMH